MKTKLASKRFMCAGLFFLSMGALAQTGTDTDPSRPTLDFAGQLLSLHWTPLVERIDLQAAGNDVIVIDADHLWIFGSLIPTDAKAQASQFILKDHPGADTP